MDNVQGTHLGRPPHLSLVEEYITLGINKPVNYEGQCLRHPFHVLPLVSITIINLLF